MKNIVCFSGGKDSTALVLWAKENLPEFTTVFCDTGWDHPITYAYVEEINRTLLGGSLVTLKSAKYPGGFVELSVGRKRVPSAMARFCTDELKVKPMIAWLKTIDDDCTVYQGVRAQESASRAAMLARQWSDDYDAWIERPLLHWLAEQCFEMMRKHGVKPNPLYLMGMGRVGCFPCIMVNFRELRAVAKFPELWAELTDRVSNLERQVGSSFWSPDDIPARFHSGMSDEPCGVCGGDGADFEYADGMTQDEWEESFEDDDNPPKREEIPCACKPCRGTGRIRKSFPWAHDVFRYIESVDENQLPLLPARSCMSVYNLCE